MDTIAPLAKSLKLAVNDDFDNEDAEKLAKELLSKPKFAGKVVLVCWRHGTLPRLAKALGATDPPGEWDAKAYDRVWRIDYDSVGKAKFTDLPQRLLHGDATK